MGQLREFRNSWTSLLITAQKKLEQQKASFSFREQFG